MPLGDQAGNVIRVGIEVGIEVAVVEVDEETGGVELVDYVAVDDCGNQINPMLVEGQVHGGLTEALAIAMSEDGTPTPFALTLHAQDADRDPLTWTKAVDPRHGTLVVSGTGGSKTISYVPENNYSGSDTFDVAVSDGIGGRDTVRVEVTIAPVNDVPGFQLELLYVAVSAGVHR